MCYVVFVCFVLFLSIIFSTTGAVYTHLHAHILAFNAHFSAHFPPLFNTYAFAGIIKDIALIISSIWLFSNPITYIQVAGYTLALFGLNMYHRFTSGHGRDPVTGEIPFPKLAREAATDKVMMVMASGLVLLLFVAQ